MVQSGSERRTNAWLCHTSALGEMLDIDFSAFSEMALYRASDRLLRHRTEIERHLFDQALSLFSLTPTVAFYDLTNTCFEGSVAAPGLATHGRPKEKRIDCRLVTLAVVVDASGFVMKSRVFAGNVVERTTLEQMLSQLDSDFNVMGACPGKLTDRPVDTGSSRLLFNSLPSNNPDLAHSRMHHAVIHYPHDLEYARQIYKRCRSKSLWQGISCSSGKTDTQFAVGDECCRFS